MKRMYFPIIHSTKMGPMLAMQISATFDANPPEKKNFLSNVSGRNKTAKKKHKSEKHSAPKNSKR